jgi:hypothetical protein
MRKVNLTRKTNFTTKKTFQDSSAMKKKLKIVKQNVLFSRKMSGTFYSPFLEMP